MKLITIGRSQNNNVVLKDPLVSRHHLQIVENGGRYWIIDLGSTNGTYVNGVRVRGRVEVDIAAVVKIGNTVLPWQRYFSIKPKRHKPLLLIPIGIGVILIQVLLITLIVVVQENRFDATVSSNKIFSRKEISDEGGEGKPHKLISLISDHHDYRKNIMADISTEEEGMTGENSQHKTTVYYPDKDGKLYETFAVPGHILLYFRKETELARQKEIIYLCGGKILMNHPPTNYYLVEVSHGKEASFMSKAHRYQEVKDVYVDQLSDVTEARIEIIDDFKNPMTKNYSHGSYVAISAKSAYPDCPTCIVPHMHDVNGEFSNARIVSSLTSIFENHKGNAPILINMSFGQYIYKYKNTTKGPKRTSEKMKWNRTFSDSLGRYAREVWITSYVSDICFLIRNLEILHEVYPKIDFIVTKSTGNNGCHELDTYVLRPLKAKLSDAQNRIMNEHFFLVSAKDDDSALPGELNASYADAPKLYHPWVTTVDISHLKHDGTSFAAPLLLGYIARRLDTEPNITIREIVDYIKAETRKDAINNKRQPGLFAIEISQQYAYERIYQFEGVLRRGVEDLCGTGVPETFYYLQMKPTEFYDASGVMEAEGLCPPSVKVTQMQVSLPHASSYVGKRIRVVGSPLYHIAGCHIHTDVYMVDAMVVGKDKHIQ